MSRRGTAGPLSARQRRGTDRRQASHQRACWARARLVALLLTLAGIPLLSLSASPALAAAPETPTAEAPSEVRAETARLRGTLDPGKEGERGSFELGSYEFLYKESASECQGGLKAPEFAEVSQGAGKEEVGQEIGGLQPHTQYTVCLLARNEAGSEETLSAPVTFTTAIPTETPETTSATKVIPTSAQLNGVLFPSAPGEPGTFHFNYGVGPTACENGQSETPRTSDEGHQGEPASEVIANLAPAMTYTFCLVAADAEGFEQKLGAVKTFTTPAAAPIVSGQAASAIRSGTATVSAQINPGGLSATYFAQYVTQAQFEAHGWSEAQALPSTPAELPASSTPVQVSEQLQGLQASTGYRFRFIATNSLAAAPGVDEQFTSAAAGLAGTALPDRRGYEQVTTAGSGEPYLTPTPISIGAAAAGFRSRLLFRAAADGERVAYVGEPGATSGTGETGPGEGNQWLATRGPEGWKGEDITPNPNGRAMYESFSDNLATAFYEGNTTPLTSDVEAGCAALYSRASSSAGFTATFTSGQSAAHCGHPLFAGSTTDQTHIIFQSEAALTPDAEQATEVPPGHGEEHKGGSLPGEGCMFGCNLYDAHGGELRLVNQLDGEAVPSATFGGYAGEHENTNFAKAISNDGSRIFWTDTQAIKNGEPNPNFEHVYALENGTNTVPVSGSGPAEYWTATPDGRYALYTEAGELWRFDTTSNTATPLTSAGAEVQGVLGTSEDAGYTYFIANAALTSQGNSAGQLPEAGHPNLYILHGTTTSFIATLSNEDNEIQSASEGMHETSSDWRANLGERLAEVTPDGRHLVFQSVQQLTGYDSTQGGNSQLEVFVYAAEAATLSCASCDPSGAPPAVYEGQVKTRLPVSLEAETYQRRWISDDGSRVFFDTAQPLAAQDTNEVQDVYEWESPSTPTQPSNTCAEHDQSSVTGGCTFLLSGGTSRDDSFLVDADAPGANVFFEHVGRLGRVESPADQNQLYDARVGGGFAPITNGCTGPSCASGTPPPPPSTSPVTSTTPATGNLEATPAKPAAKPLTRRQRLALALKQCKKHRRASQRHACERLARKRYGAITTKRHTSRKATAQHRRAS